VSPPITAQLVESSRPSLGSNPTVPSALTTQPSSARIVFHAMVRIRNVTKNGRITKPRIRFLYRPALNAITYASGNASSMHSTVAAMA
jgi:hypothetical protein